MIMYFCFVYFKVTFSVFLIIILQIIFKNNNLIRYVKLRYYNFIIVNLYFKCESLILFSNIYVCLFVIFLESFWWKLCLWFSSVNKKLIDSHYIQTSEKTFFKLVFLHISNRTNGPYIFFYFVTFTKINILSQKCV